jgi:hypothetical protein
MNIHVFELKEPNIKTAYNYLYITLFFYLVGPFITCNLLVYLHRDNRTLNFLLDVIHSS